MQRPRLRVSATAGQEPTVELIQTRNRMRKIPNPRMNSQAQGEGYGDKGKLYKPQETTQLQPEEERQLTKAGEREKSREWGRSKGVCAKAARWGRGTFRPFIESACHLFSGSGRLACRRKFTGAVLHRGRAPWRHSRCRGTERRPAGGRGNVALLASVGAQLLYLAVHLVEGVSDPGLQPCPTMVGEVPREAPRFLERPLASSRSTRAFCSSESWDSAICRPVPRCHLSVTQPFYLDLSFSDFARFTAFSEVRL
jgi:hypothetical protein